MAKTAPAPAAAPAAAAPKKDTTTYVVTHVPIRHKGVMHKVDDDIELTDAEAKNLNGLVMRKGEAAADSAAGADGAATDGGDTGSTGDGAAGD